MISYDFAHVVQRLYEQVRGQNVQPVNVGTEDRPQTMYFPQNPFVREEGIAFYTRLVVSCNNNGYEKDGSTHHPEWERHYSKALHFLITKNPNVFVAVTEHLSSVQEIPLDDWNNTSNHDTCWRSDGVESVITQTMFEAHAYCFDHVPPEHAPNRKSDEVRMRLETRFLGGEVFGFYRLKHEAKNPRDTYRRKLTELVPLETVIGWKEKAK